MDGSGRKTHLDGWGVGSPPRRAGRSQESFLVAERDHQWSEGPPGGLGVLGRDGRGWEGFPEGQDVSVVLLVGRVGSGVPPRGPGVIRRLSQRAGRGQESHPKGREGS